MIRAIKIRRPWLPAFAVCMLLALLESMAAAAVWFHSDGSVLEFFVLYFLILGGAVTHSTAIRIYDSRPRRPFYGRIDLEGMQ